MSVTSPSNLDNVLLTGDLPPLAVQSALAGKVAYPPGGRFGPRLQRDLQIVLLHTGSMSVQVDGKAQNVPPGHMILLAPGHVEEFTFSPTQDTWHRWIAVTVPDVPRAWLATLAQLPAYLPISERMTRIVDLMLMLEVSRGDFEATLNDLGHAALMLYLAEAQRFQSHRTMHPAVLAVKEYVSVHYAQNLSLTMLAQIADVTPAHLISLFQRDEGTTPMKSLWRVRLNKSIELLTNTGLPIGDIAEKTGFKTSYHFARTMKQLTGKTASEIRAADWQNRKAPF